MCVRVIVCVCVFVFTVDMEEVKRVTAVLNTLYNEKMRANKPKSKKKQLGKAKLNVGSGPLVVSTTINVTFNHLYKLKSP